MLYSMLAYSLWRKNVARSYFFTMEIHRMPECYLVTFDYLNKIGHLNTLTESADRAAWITKA